MQVFGYFSDHEQDMRSEGRILEQEAAFPTTGICRDCLASSNHLDSGGICDRCEDQPTREFLLPLLAPLQLTGSAQGTI